MSVTDRNVLALVALLLVAPVGAAVVIAALLLFGVKPDLVFLPGFSSSRDSKPSAFTSLTGWP